MLYGPTGLSLSLPPRGIEHDDLPGRGQKRDHFGKQPRVGSEARDQQDRRPVPVHLLVELDVTDLGVGHSQLSSLPGPLRGSLWFGRRTLATKGACSRPLSTARLVATGWLRPPVAERYGCLG